MPSSPHPIVASSGSFLITPSIALMIWTLLGFALTEACFFYGLVAGLLAAFIV